MCINENYFGFLALFISFYCYVIFGEEKKKFFYSLYRLICVWFYRWAFFHYMDTYYILIFVVILPFCVISIISISFVYWSGYSLIFLLSFICSVNLFFLLSFAFKSLFTFLSGCVFVLLSLLFYPWGNLIIQFIIIYILIINKHCYFLLYFISVYSKIRFFFLSLNKL